MVLSLIVAPSLIVPPHFFNHEICHGVLNIDILRILISMNLVSSTTALQCYLLFLTAFTIFSPKYEFKCTMIVLIMDPSQKLVLAPGLQLETIWYLSVQNKITPTMNLSSQTCSEIRQQKMSPQILKDEYIFYQDTGFDFV